MANLTIRNLDEDLKTRLRVAAALNGHSMEEETRQILRRALTDNTAASQGLGSLIAQRFASIAQEDEVAELTIPPRTELASAVEF